MSKVKQLKELTEKEFDRLEKSGLLKTIYPDAPNKYADIKGVRPEPIENPDLTALKEICKGHLDGLEEGNSNENDKHYIYEIALECIYGKNVWSFVNANLK